MAVDHDIGTWPRRNDAAKRLGVNVTQLRRYEHGRITPILDANGDNRFDPAELEIETVNWLYENWLVMSGRKTDGALPAHSPPHGTAPRFRLITDTLAEARAPHLRSEGERAVLCLRGQVDVEERRRLQAEDAAREGAAKAPSAAGASEAQHNPPDDGREPSGR